MARNDPAPAAARSVEVAFDAACAALPPLARGARLLLGCSAGGDSTALLALAASRAKRHAWELLAVHVDHRQRPESADEARWVAGLADALGVDCAIEPISDGLAAASPLSEDVMRQARHEIFRRSAAKLDAAALVLAHHADDRAETFLIRLLAGSGPTGLAAIRPLEAVAGLIIVRPLLAVRRDDLRIWLRHHGLDWREDPTNASLATKRGWIRHALLPAIRDHIGLDPSPRIARAAELIDDEARALNLAADALLGQLRLAPPAPALARLDLAHPIWVDADPVLRRQMLRRWLWSLRRGPHPPGFEAVAEALVFAAQARPRAELRTVGHIHIVHLKNSLLAFAPEIATDARKALARELLPPAAPKAKPGKKK